MQKIDVTPSVAMVNACFNSEEKFAINYKGGVRIEAEPLDHGAWKLRRLKHGIETSWIDILAYKDLGTSKLTIKVAGNESIATGMARGIAPYHESDNRPSEYYTAVISVYGGKVSHILSVDR